MIYSNKVFKDVAKFKELYYTTNNKWNGFVWCPRTEEHLLSALLEFFKDKYEKSTES